MYDFYFGTRQDIELHPKKFLLSIKRMLPRWCNSIPDSEYLAIFDAMKEIQLPDNPVFVETGSGASSIILCYLAIVNNGELYTWDTNGSKLSYLRSIINDTLMRHFSQNNLSNHWKHIAYNSNSDVVGIPILKEMGKKVSACFLDSEHTWGTLGKELGNICEIIGDEAIVAIDDGNYQYLYRNTAYLNMIRKKHNLLPIKDSKNIGMHFFVKTALFLENIFPNVEHLQDTYKENYSSDIFWSYYNSDREAMGKLDMEKTDNLKHRFDAWKVTR